MNTFMQIFEIIPWWITAVLGIGVAGGVFQMARKTRRAIRRTTNHIAAIGSLLTEVDLQADTTPKTVSGGDKLYLPAILKDFPEFEIDVAKALVCKYVEDVVNGRSVAVSKEIGSQPWNFAISFRMANTASGITGYHFHRMAISDYDEYQNSAIVTFQIAFEYRIRVPRKSGARAKPDGTQPGTKLIQNRWEVKYSTALTDGAEEDLGAVGVGLRCGHCGSPVKERGTKVCEYCGNEIAVSMKNRWRIISVREI